VPCWLVHWFFASEDKISPWHFGNPKDHEFPRPADPLAALHLQDTY